MKSSPDEQIPLMYEAIEQAVATDEQAEATERLPGAAPEAASAPAQREAPTVDAPDTVQRPEPAAPTADVATAAQYRPVAAEEAQKQTYNPVGEVPESVVTAPQYRPLRAKKAAPPDPTAASDRPAAGAAAGAAAAGLLTTKIVVHFVHFSRFCGVVKVASSILYFVSHFGHLTIILYTCEISIFHHNSFH